MKRIFLVIASAFVIMSCTPPRSLEYKTYHNFAVRSLGFNKTTVALDLEYYNPNNYGLQLKNSDLDIFINGTLFGHSTSDTLINIPRRGTFILPVTFDLDMKNAFKNAFNALSGKEVSIRLSGKIKVGKGNVFMYFPVKYETNEKFSLF